MFVEKDSYARTEWLNMRTHTRKKQRMWLAGWCDSKPTYFGQATTFSRCWCTIPRCNALCPAENFLPHMAQSSKTNTTKNCQGRLDWRNFQKRISTTYATCVPILVNNSSQHAALGCIQIFCFTVPESATIISDTPAWWRRSEKWRY